MKAETPEQAHALFVQYFNDGDIEALISLYEPTATFVPSEGEPITGHTAIRSALEGFLALKGHRCSRSTRRFEATILACCSRVGN